MSAAKDRRAKDGSPRELDSLPRLAAVAGFAAVGSAVAVAVVPSVDFAWRSEPLHVAIETTGALIALLTGYLVLGRYMVERGLRELALVCALTMLALTQLAFSTLPALLGSETSGYSTWVAVAGRGLAAAAMAVAAFLPDLRIWRPRRAGVFMAVVSAGLIAVLALGLALASHALPTADAVGPSPTHSDLPDLEGAPGYLVLLLLTMLLSAAAAVGFALRARRGRDELIGWCAVGASLAAGARLHYLLFPSAEPGWVFSGDLVRLCFYLALLVGALREIRHYQRRVAVAAALDERRRLARDLHDGLAQELAFIRMQSERLVRAPEASRAVHVAAAAERALDESRAAIRALTRRAEDPFDAEVAQVAEHLTARAGARLRLDLDTAATVSADQRDELLRILREAVTNGVRHGGAEAIAVELKGGDGLRLTVRDNGRGFDPRAMSPRSDGFGLTTMRERATAMGARLRISSRFGEGTEVEVVLP